MFCRRLTFRAMCNYEAGLYDTGTTFIYIVFRVLAKCCFKVISGKQRSLRSASVFAVRCDVVFVEQREYIDAFRPVGL